jgi:Double zinc ribbon
MIYCMKCGNQLPDDARFCAKCGTAVGGGGAASGPAAPPAAAPSAGPTIAPSGAQELKCPACGAPIKPDFGEMVISCEYCGGTVTLGGAGWKQLSKHTMLSLSVADRDAALKAVHDWVDTGFLHRHAFEESKVTEERLTFVPFWVFPTTATTTYQYQDAAVSIGSTVGTMAAGALLGEALGGRRGNVAVVPILGGSVVNATRSDTISGQYEFPVVAVKSMTEYQPKDYTFALVDRTVFDKKSVPAGAPVLNGDLGEDAGQNTAKAYVQQLASEAAHKKHSMVSNLKCDVQVSEGELVHVPIWYFALEHKGGRTVVLVDGHSGRVIRAAT